MPTWPYGGYDVDAGQTIVRLDPGGPAEAAGLQVGDRILSIGGIPVGALPALPRRRLPPPGESQMIGIERRGQPLSLLLTYGSYPLDSWILPRVKMAVVALAFLILGTWAFFTQTSAPSRLFAFFSLAFGFSSFEGPRLGPFEGLAGLAEVSVGLLSVLLLLHFLLWYPEKKGLLKRRAPIAVLYGLLLPWLIFGVMDLITDPLLFFPFNIATLFLVLGYVLFAVTAVVHTLFRYPKEKWGPSGLSLILLATAGALFVSVFPALAGWLGWETDPPGSELYFLAVLPIPAAMARAVAKHSRMVPMG